MVKISPHFSSVQLSIKNQFSENYHISIHFQPKTPYKKRYAEKVEKTEITHAHVKFIPFDSQIKK